MGINVKCPRCGSERCQLSNEEAKRDGCLYFLFFGVWYIFFLIIKLLIGLIVFLLVDWWVAIIRAHQGKGYVWLSKRILSGRRKIYFCHDCGFNFRA